MHPHALSQGVRILETEGPHPVVYGEWLRAGPDKLTVLIYGHYDVQVGDQSLVPCLICTAPVASGSAKVAYIQLRKLCRPHLYPTLGILSLAQPVDPLDEWETGPFNVTLKDDGYFYGRGVDDDKGGVLMAIQAVEGLLRHRPAGASDPLLPVNVKFMLEGQVGTRG